jgi:hypothetical protein
MSINLNTAIKMINTAKHLETLSDEASSLNGTKDEYK